RHKRAHVLDASDAMSRNSIGVRVGCDLCRHAQSKVRHGTRLTHQDVALLALEPRETRCLVPVHACRASDNPAATSTACPRRALVRQVQALTETGIENSLAAFAGEL